LCGIAGWVGRPLPGGLDSLLNLLAHRGPDDQGSWEDPHGMAGLGHRRLSILDLSPSGHQPMASEDGRAQIVFNGEIYNFRELRKELETQGTTFRSHSDTEVLLALYRKEGRSMVKRLNGVFAFAIWDEDRRELFCARDPIGVKPFYWTFAEGRFLFASEAKVLLRFPGVEARVDSLAMACHLAYIWCPHPRSAFRDIWKLSPGHFLVVDVDGRIKEQEAFWTWSSREDEGGGQAHRIGTFKMTLQESVERQLVSDVPVGLFLSGGLDSSAIAHAYRTARAGEPIQPRASKRVRIAERKYVATLRTELDGIILPDRT